jgi:signal transduction histidine kinase
MTYRMRPAYLVLLVVWLLVVVWQVVEHGRFERNARGALINRAKDISSTVGLVLRSERHFGLISQERLEAALSALIKPEELNGVSLFNARGEVVASAGTPIDLNQQGLMPTGEHWDARSVTLINLVDLGTNVTADLSPSRPTIVIPRSEFPMPTNRPPASPPGRPHGDRDERREFNPADGATPQGPSPADRERRRGRGDSRPRFGRPFWMSEEEYNAAIENKGVHSFAMVLSTQPVIIAARQDMWVRVIISAFASIAALGLGIAWRNLSRSHELEVRLARAAELNDRLKEMNVAAAGLAHETRNPLNIIRGLAQIISRQQNAPAEVREKSCGILNEVDRVTVQLNEFINYSRPRELRRSAVKLESVVRDVAHALASDLEDKAIKLSLPTNLPVIDADEQLLRQALFNLILNAIQAVDREGEIEVAAGKSASGEGWIDVRDNGHGLPPDQVMEIFKPYVTHQPNGTGLGLAVVQQIVTAHSWEVRCLPNKPKGTLFRISHLRIVG